MENQIRITRDSVRSALDAMKRRVDDNEREIAEFVSREREQLDNERDNYIPLDRDVFFD